MSHPLRNLMFILFTSALLFACNDKGNGTPVDDTASGSSAVPPVTAASPNLAFTQSKVFRFTWTDVSDATFYRLLENPDGTSGFTQVGGDTAQGTQTIDHVVPLYARVNAQYILQTCNANGCTDSTTVTVSGNLVSAIGYLKASNTGTGDEFGLGLSLSADGNTLAVGASYEGSNATGINGSQVNDLALNSGAAYVFTRNGSRWSQQAYLKASNTNVNDSFGITLSLNTDGTTLVVGAPAEGNSGSVYVFTLSGANWSEQTMLKASNADTGDIFGTALSLSSDGNTLAVGDTREASNGVGADPQSNNSASRSGAAYIFTRSGVNWSQQAYLKASNTQAEDRLGDAISLSGDGNTLVVGAFGQNNFRGAAYIFTRSGVNWTEQAELKASNPDRFDNFGITISLSADGNTLAVAAPGEDSAATGIDGIQGNDPTLNKYGSGAVYIFTNDGTTWSQQAYLKASSTGASDSFGAAVSLSNNGDTLAVGADRESSNARGVDGDQADNSTVESGAAYLFTRESGIWTEQAYLKPSNTAVNSTASVDRDAFGTSVSLSANGKTLAVGATGESSNSLGVNSDQTDNSARESGAVYLF